MKLLVTNRLRTIFKYIRLYIVAIRFGLILESAYRFSFIVELGVELGYQLVTILFMQVIFSNISQIGGWSYYQILFLTGLNIISSEIIVGAFGVYNLWALPDSVKNGEIDFWLVKPVNSLFSLGLFRPYVSAFAGSLSGFYLMFYSVEKMSLILSPVNIIAGVIMLLIGAILVFFIMTIISSFTFKFINAHYLPRIASSIAFQFKIYPHEIYQGIWKLILYFAVPVIFMSSVPAQTIIKGLDGNFLILGIVLLIIFYFFTMKIWKRMLSYYSSASS